MDNKDIILIADALRGTKPTQLNGEDTPREWGKNFQWNHTVNRITVDLAAKYPSFNFEAWKAYLESDGKVEPQII